MNRRGKRLALTVAATGLVVLLGIVILFQGVVRDHIQAWHFQLTKETVTIEPDPALDKVPTGKGFSFDQNEGAASLASDSDQRNVQLASAFLQVLASYSGREVIVASEYGGNKFSLVARPEHATTDLIRAILGQAGLHVIEQRFPRRAYIVVPGQPVVPDKALLESIESINFEWSYLSTYRVVNPDGSVTETRAR